MTDPTDSECIADLFGRSTTEPDPAAPAANASPEPVASPDDNAEFIRALFTDSPKDES